MKNSEIQDRDKGILGGEEVQKIVSEFISSRHRGIKLAFHETKLTTNGGVPIYHLEGSFQPHSRSLVGRFAYPPTKCTFNAKVDAVQGRVLSYELR